MSVDHRHPIVEICVEGVDGLISAQRGGADRAELCASLLEGGITPSQGTIRAALEVATIPFHVIVRPRGGDFLYSQLEFSSMLSDVQSCRELGVAGVVVGCLREDGTIDEPRMRSLVEAAGPLAVTCHRAFDMTRDPFAALEALIRSGIGRVLTSGQRDTAMEGVELLGELVRVAEDRIVVMGCGDLRPDNVSDVVQRANLREIHFAALRDVPSNMIYRNTKVGMGGTELDREYRTTVTDEAMVREKIAAARSG